MKIIIKRVLDRYDLAHEYFLKHIEILKYYKVEGVSTMSPCWKYNSNAHMVIMMDDNRDVMAGAMRLEIATSQNKLPFEKALKQQHQEVSNVVEDYISEGGVAEFCGLWVDPYYKKSHIPEELTAAGIELAETLGIPNVVAFANNHSRPITEELGFTQKSVGAIDKFYYPDERYETHLMERSIFEKVSMSSESHQPGKQQRFRHR